jgi:hypothetical protein
MADRQPPVSQPSEAPPPSELIRVVPDRHPPSATAHKSEVATVTEAQPTGGREVVVRSAQTAPARVTTGTRSQSPRRPQLATRPAILEVSGEEGKAASRAERGREVTASTTKSRQRTEPPLKDSKKGEPARDPAREDLRRQRANRKVFAVSLNRLEKYRSEFDELLRDALSGLTPLLNSAKAPKHEEEGDDSSTDGDTQLPLNWCLCFSAESNGG